MPFNKLWLRCKVRKELLYHEAQERNELSRKMSRSVECPIRLKRYRNIEEPVRISVSLVKELISLLFRTPYKKSGILI